MKSKNISTVLRNVEKNDEKIQNLPPQIPSSDAYFGRELNDV